MFIVCQDICLHVEGWRVIRITLHYNYETERRKGYITFHIYLKEHMGFSIITRRGYHHGGSAFGFFGKIYSILCVVYLNSYVLNSFN